MTIKTNPAYAYLAYRRAIVVQLMDDLRDTYLALSSNTPRKIIVCEDVFREDSEVPEHALSAVYEELEEEAENLKLELARFTFGKVKEGHGLLNSKTAEARREQEQGEVEEEGSDGASKGRKKGRRARRR